MNGEAFTLPTFCVDILLLFFNFYFKLMKKNKGWKGTYVSFLSRNRIICHFLVKVWVICVRAVLKKKKNSFFGVLDPILVIPPLSSSPSTLFF